MTSHWRKDAFTPKEVSRLLHVSLSTVYRMINAGILMPAENTLGSGTVRGRLIPRSEVDHYIESLKTSARRNTEVASV